MKKLFLSASFFVLLYIAGIAQTTTILFDKDAYTITPKAKIKLDSLLRIIKNSNPQQEICLIGYTDSDADDAYNKTLSFNRAASVKNYLLTNGISNRIHIESKGESRLINNDVTDAEKGLNRRVQIIQDYKTSNTIFSSTTKEVQRFEINPNRDTLITCKEGTNIHVDAGIFENTNASEPVIIQVQEYLTKSDFVLTNLTTTHTDGRMIESRGMIYIEAFQNDKKLSVQKGKSVDILFKDRKMGDSTLLFTGSMHHDNIVWEQNGFKKKPATRVSESDGDENETVIYKNKLLFFKSYSGRVRYSKKFRYDSIKGEPYKTVEIYNEGYRKIKKYKVNNDSALIKEYNRYLAKKKEIEYREKQQAVMAPLLLNSPSLGWINCDRFYKYQNKKINIIVKYEGDFVPEVVLVFKNINSVMPYTYRVDDEIIFENIPENITFDIIGLYKNEATVLLAQKSSVAQEKIEIISFIKVDSEQLSSLLKNLN